MEEIRLKNLVEEIMSSAGISINGSKPWDIQIKDEKVYGNIFRDGSLGFGMSYMDSHWECEDLVEFFKRLIPIDPERKIKKNWKLLCYYLSYVIFNKNSKSRAFQIGEKHYDLGNELFRNMLDKRLVYSCAYWKDAKNLDDAQEDKLDLICKKLHLRPGDKVLDIGCGWGSFVKYAVEKYDVRAVGITVSVEQAELASQLCKGLPIEIRLQDYRELNEKFDHIVSVGMFEHVGLKNHRTYMKTVHRCMKDEGLFLLQTIGSLKSGFATNQWIDKYIFPNSLIPSMKQIVSAVENLFALEDWHNFGFHYFLTLMEWFKNFDKNWDHLKNKYDERFYRMWKYYLLSCAASFKCGSNQLWQIVLSKKGFQKGYESIR